MAISIRNPKVEHLARELAQRSGATMTEAIADALEASLAFSRFHDNQSFKLVHRAHEFSPG